MNEETTDSINERSQPQSLHKPTHSVDLFIRIRFRETEVKTLNTGGGGTRLVPKKRTAATGQLHWEPPGPLGYLPHVMREK